MLAGDGRVHSTLDLAPVGSTHNYTRSYYCNGRDYIVTGSCEEAVVRIACGATGRILRDVALQVRGRNDHLLMNKNGAGLIKECWCVLVECRGREAWGGLIGWLLMCNR